MREFTNINRGRRIRIGDRLIYNGTPVNNVRFGRVTPGNIYESIGRRGPNIFIETNIGAEVSFSYAAFNFADSENKG